METENSQQKANEARHVPMKGVVKRAGQILFTMLLMGGLLFVAAGTVSWPAAWIYLGVYLVDVIINAVFLWRRNPELIAERAESRPDTKKWDKVVTRVASPLFFSIFIVCGLDKRLSWTGLLPTAVHISALVIFIIGSGLASWALISNAFFTVTVRIQHERNHRVVSSGPYRYIRHPGYSGWMLTFLATPLLVGSLWGLIPAGLSCLTFIIRTYFEDRTLHEELSGYRSYSRRVRHRLVPGSW